MAGDDRDAAQGDRREVDHLRTTRKPDCRSSPSSPSATYAALAAFVRGSKLPIEDRQEHCRAGREAHGRAQMDDASRARREPRHSRRRDARLSGVGLASSRRCNAQFDANPKAGRRLTPVEKRAIEVATRLSTYKAYSGDRVADRRIWSSIMPRPSNQPSIWPTRPARSRNARTKRESADDCRSSSSTSFRRSPLTGTTFRKTIVTIRPRTRSSTNATRPGFATIRSGFRSKCS